MANGVTVKPTFDNQSFDCQEAHSSSSCRKRPPPTPQDDLFAKAHKASVEAGLIPLEQRPNCKMLPSREFEKVKDAQNRSYHKKSCSYQGHRSTQVNVIINIQIF